MIGLKQLKDRTRTLSFIAHVTKKTCIARRISLKLLKYQTSNLFNSSFKQKITFLVPELVLKAHFVGHIPGVLPKNRGGGGKKKRNSLC